MKGAWANVRLDISWFGGKISSDLKVKGPPQGNQNSSGLQRKVAYWPALAVGSAAQLAAAHCPKKTDFGPAVCSQPHYGLHLTMFSSN